jgi:hypothetical protein
MSPPVSHEKQFVLEEWLEKATKEPLLSAFIQLSALKFQECQMKSRRS